MKASKRETAGVVSALTGRVSALAVETGLEGHLHFSETETGHRSRAQVEHCPEKYETGLE